MLNFFIAESTLFLASWLNLLSFFKHIFKQPVKATAPAKPQVNKVEKVVEEDDEEERVVVALAASIMAGEGKINPNLHVKRIERIK